jgi:hypothetical protein
LLRFRAITFDRLKSRVKHLSDASTIQVLYLKFATV